MERFDRIFAKVCDHLAFWVCGSMVIIMILYVGANVFARYALGEGGVVGTYAYVGALLVPFTYFSLSWAWYKKGYIVLDIVQRRLKGRVHWGFQFAFLLITTVLFIVFCYGGLLGAIESYALKANVGEIGLKTPQWIWQATIVIGTFLVVIRNILDLVRMVRTGEIVPLLDR